MSEQSPRRDGTAFLLKRRQVLGAAAAAGWLLGAPQVHASQDAWPAKPIRIVVPYPPGGFTDQMARMVQPELQKQLGVPVIVDNKPGANGQIGVAAMAAAEPDGYTFAIVIPAYTVNTTLYPQLPYAPEGLSGISLLGLSPLAAATAPGSRFQDARQVVAFARANPGAVTFASSGTGSAAHLTGELWRLRSGVDMRHIPYKGASAALADVMGGQVDLLFDPISSLSGLARGGKVRLIGVAAERRLPDHPDVPTLAEQGIAGVVSSTWAGIIGRQEIAPAIQERLARALAGIVQAPAMVTRMKDMGITAQGSSAAEFNAFLQAETRKWGGLIRQANITL